MVLIKQDDSYTRVAGDNQVSKEIVAKSLELGDLTTIDMTANTDVTMEHSGFIYCYSYDYGGGPRASYYYVYVNDQLQGYFQQYHSDWGQGFGFQTEVAFNKGDRVRFNYTTTATVRYYND